MTLSKDTLYIDVEDEITAVIDKVVSSKGKIIAVILPKRATVFQSVVNMKLLDKAAQTAQKNLVLVTSDKGVIAIASTVKVHISKTPTSKPYIPETVISHENEEIIDSSDSDPLDIKSKTASNDDVIELDNTVEVDSPKTDIKVPNKKNKILKIPDFSSFRLRIMLSLVALVTVVGLWFMGFVILPKATVTINTDVMKSTINTTATLKIGDVKLDLKKNIIPAQLVQVKKVNTVTVDTTGKKDVGTPAVGTMNLTNCINDGKNKLIPVGTSFSAGSQTFVTTDAVTLDFAIYASNKCVSKSFGRDKNVAVKATQPGSGYNIKAQSYTSSVSGIQAFGSDMSGGVSKLINVVSSEDVKNAQQKIDGLSKPEALKELKQQLQEKKLVSIESTFGQGKPVIVATPAIGTKASSVKVSMTTDYSLWGITSENINSLLDSEVKKNMGDKQQNIRNNGLNSVAYQLVDTPNKDERLLSIQTIATIGPKLDKAKLQKQIAGKKRGDIEQMLESIDGVRSVDIVYSPAWITTTPKSANKIVIVFNESNAK